jgi:hypothetical protein
MTSELAQKSSWLGEPVTGLGPECPIVLGACFRSGAHDVESFLLGLIQAMHEHHVNSVRRSCNG